MNHINYIKELKSIRNAYILLLISINIFNIDILPKWLAFIIIYQNIKEIGKEEKSVYLIKNITLSLIAYHFAIWLLNMVNVSISSYIVHVFFSILQLYVNYQLMTNIINISVRHNSKYTNRLKRVRDILTIMFTISSFIEFIADNEIIQSMIMVYVIIYILLSIKQIFDLSMYIIEEKDKSY